MQYAKAQGCSDAGFCTMGAMKPDQYFNRRISIKLRSIEFAQYFGMTRFGDFVYNYYVDANLAFNDRNNLQIKLPYVVVDGALATTSGIGDLSLSATRILTQTEKGQFNATLGAKVPLGESNLTTSEGLTLPMYNQAGLGTFDVIAGLSWISKNWMFAAGYQHAFGITDNQFLWEDWIGNPLEEKALEYTQSRDLERGVDIMLRAERNFRFTNWNFNLGLLPIWRLTEDKILIPDEEGTGEVIRHIEGSTGLAMTLLVGGGYQFNVKSGIKIMNGFRLVQRDKNPDGLSRKFVSNIGYVYKF